MNSQDRLKDNARSVHVRKGKEGKGRERNRDVGHLAFFTHHGHGEAMR